MKMFHNVVSSIICCVKEAHASIVLDRLIEWVQFVLQNCETLQNYSFKQGKKKCVRGLSDK